MCMFVLSSEAYARDQIRIVGSSTVFPYTQAVAEEFGKKTGSPAPVVESTGIGGGMKIFCQGIGEEYPDIVNASRPIIDSEKNFCDKNGVTDITEIQIGFDGISIAQSRKSKPLQFTKKQLFLALAAKVPVDGKLVDNPYKTWNEIDASLPNTPIIVYGPPPTSGTRDAFVELAMEEGCVGIDLYKSKDECNIMRQDGPFIEAGENDNLIVQRIEADLTSIGIFGYSFLYENQDKLHGISVDGVEPSFDTIADGSYGLSRPLFIYVKNAHRKMVADLDAFIDEYTSEEAMGEDGYLVDRGLVVKQ